MLTYLLLAGAMLALMVALPFWDPEGFGVPPLGVLTLLAIAALVMVFRGRDPHSG